MLSGLQRAGSVYRHHRTHRRSVAAHLRTQQPMNWVQFILGAFLLVDGYPFPGLPVALPFAEVVMILLIGCALFGRHRFDQSRFMPLILVAGAALVALIIASELHDVDWSRRGTRIALLAIFVVCLAVGRLNARSIILGLSLGLVINAALFYLGLAPDTYGGVLTGWVGDKNVAGLLLVAVPFLLLPFISRTWMVPVVVVLGGWLLFLTGSRTSLTAFAIALLWAVLSPRRHARLRAGFLALAFWFFTWLEDNFARAFIFEDRDGTDLLRSRIDEAARLKTEIALPWGLGAGESRVLLGSEQEFFFHDSYLALLVEGGWIFAISIVLIYVIIGFRPFTTLRRTPAIISCEAAVIALLFCALKLGEVFITIVGALVLGVTLALRSKEHRRLVALQLAQQQLVSAKPTLRA